MQQVSKRLHTGGRTIEIRKHMYHYVLVFGRFVTHFPSFVLLLLSVLESFTILILFPSHHPSHTYTYLFLSLSLYLQRNRSICLELTHIIVVLSFHIIQHTRTSAIPGLYDTHRRHLFYSRRHLVSF